MVFLRSNSGSFLDLYFPRVVLVACILPVIALFFCEAWSVVIDFQKTTSTSCRSRRPWNFLPSISEATGSIAPQKFVWRLLIGLHATPRIAIAGAYFKLHTELFPPSDPKTVLWHVLAGVDLVAHVMEIMCLVGLTFVSSTDNYAIHEKCFYGFLVCAHIHMMLVCVFYSKGRTVIGHVLSYKERRALKLKYLLTGFSFCMLGMALYFFKRHEVYCEDYVYSMFALTEIGIVLSNIGFHGTASLDFSHCYLSLLDVEDNR